MARDMRAATYTYFATVYTTVGIRAAPPGQSKPRFLYGLWGALLFVANETWRVVRRAQKVVPDSFDSCSLGPVVPFFPVLHIPNILPILLEPPP
jgi:hypothetical protein